MYATRDLVICQVHAAFIAGAVTLQLKPFAGMPPWHLPPVTTDAGAVVPTFGNPFVILTLMDVANVAAAKAEQIRCQFSGVDIGGGVYEATACERGFNGTTDQDWAPGELVMCQIGQAHADLASEFMAIHTQEVIQHNSELILWDGTNLKFNAFRIVGAGRGKHGSVAGYYEIAMPANGSTITGHGGAAPQVVAGGVINVPANHALYYELNVSGNDASRPDNFRLVSFTADFVVPKHWIFIAGTIYQAANDPPFSLRMGSGAVLSPWREIGAGANPAFQNAWVNFGLAYSTAAFRKLPDQTVQLKGIIKTGAIGTIAFTLPIGFRPAKTGVFAVVSNSGFGVVEINSSGQIGPTIGNSTSVCLDGIEFLAEV